LYGSARSCDALVLRGATIALLTISLAAGPDIVPGSGLRRYSPPWGDNQSGVSRSAISLNDAQVAVLRWIAAGSPGGVMEGYTHRDFRVRCPNPRPRSDLRSGRQVARRADRPRPRAARAARTRAGDRIRGLQPRGRDTCAQTTEQPWLQERSSRPITPPRARLQAEHRPLQR
jgi:hypothetical protein